MKVFFLSIILFCSISSIAQLPLLQYYAPFHLTMSTDSTIQTSASAIKEYGSKVYVATNHGLYIYSHGTWQNIPTSTIGDSLIYDLDIDHHGNVWMIGDWAVIKMDSNYNVTRYTTSNSTMPYYTMQDIAVDTADNVWVTGSPWPLYNSGVTKFDGTNWTSYDSTNSPIPNDWYTVMADHSGNIWLNGYHTGDLIRFNGSNWTTIADTAMHFPGGQVTAMACDKTGIIWLNVNYGDDNLVRYDGFNFNTVYSGIIVAGDPTNQIVIDELGNKWLTSAGLWLNKFDGVSLTQYADTSLAFNGFTNIQAIGSNIWIAPYNSYNNNIDILADQGINKISGEVYFDSNADGFHQTNELNLPNVLLHLMPENRYIFSTTSGYEIPLIDTSGNYSVEIIPPVNWQTGNAVNNISQSFQGEISDSIDFDLHCDTSITDVAISLTSTVMLPGFNSIAWVNIRNKSTQTISDTITVVLDSRLAYNSSVPVADYQSNDTVKWFYTNLLPLETRIYKIYSTLSANSVSGDTISIYSQIMPVVGDTLPSDNSDTLLSAVFSSFDPNSKEVSPKGVGPNGAILPGQELEYVINFQNTGTYTAFTVMIRDTLSDELDLSTLEITGFSHPVTYQLYGRTLVFTFENILLPDSNSNEPESHGFVKYKIRPNTNISNGSVINNVALIFFDYNLPVITNSVTNTIDIFLSSKALNEDKIFSIYPSPASDVINVRLQPEIHALEIYNAQGQKLKSLSVHNSLIQLDIRNYLPGIYFIKGIGDNNTGVTKFIKE